MESFTFEEAKMGWFKSDYRDLKRVIVRLEEEVSDLSERVDRMKENQKSHRALVANHTKRLNNIEAWINNDDVGPEPPEADGLDNNSLGGVDEERLRLGRG